MPLQYVKYKKPFPRMQVPGMGSLGRSVQQKRKRKKQAERAFALMQLRKKEFEEAQMKAEELKVEVEELGKVLGVLAEVAKIKGVPEDKINSIVEGKGGLAKVMEAAKKGPPEGGEKLSPTEQAALQAKAAENLKKRIGRGFWS